ncbi:MAG: hypothetical protein SCK28_15070, partial [Bacillota bacterium]|nr:hypothetical protein [Bacillota bacterium]
VKTSENINEEAETEYQAHKEDVPMEFKEGMTKLDDTYLNSLSVVELRRLARQVPGLSIQGRQISKANKETLINAITIAQGNSTNDTADDETSGEN